MIKLLYGAEATHVDVEQVDLAAVATSLVAGYIEIYPGAAFLGAEMDPLLFTTAAREREEVERVSEDFADGMPVGDIAYWGVYGTLNVGGCDMLAECDTKTEAARLYAALETEIAEDYVLKQGAVAAEPVSAPQVSARVPTALELAAEEALRWIIREHKARDYDKEDIIDTLADALGYGVPVDLSDYDEDGRDITDDYGESST